MCRKLPLEQSLKHFEFSLRHIGFAVGIALIGIYACVLLFGLWSWSQSLNRSQERATWTDWKSAFDIRPLWIGLAPALMLAMRGAGLNPYVSMPSAFGLVLAALIPMLPLLRLQWENRVLACALVLFGALGLGISARSGIALHAKGEFNSMQAHQQTLHSIVVDANQSSRSAVRYGTIHIHYLNTNSLSNAILFDMPHVQRDGTRSMVEGVELQPEYTFARPAPAEWVDVQGQTMEDKVATLVASANSDVDYLIIPEPESADWISKHMKHVVVNQYCSLIRQSLLSSSNWQYISEPIINNEHEVVRVYRNASRKPATDMAAKPTINNSQR